MRMLPPWKLKLYVDAEAFVRDEFIEIQGLLSIGVCFLTDLLKVIRFSLHPGHTWTAVLNFSSETMAIKPLPIERHPFATKHFITCLLLFPCAI
jgi:hypothetical protein